MVNHPPLIYYLPAIFAELESLGLEEVINGALGHMGFPEAVVLAREAVVLAKVAVTMMKMVMKVAVTLTKMATQVAEEAEVSQDHHLPLPSVFSVFYEPLIVFF